MDYTCDRLMGDPVSAERYAGGSFACLYLAPYNYHRIHMPLDGVLRSTRYVPGHLFSVNASTARAVPDLFARNERVICDFDAQGRCASCWSARFSSAASRLSLRVRSILHRADVRRRA
jgi:phosphatidylserine decarboxylase precursor